MSRTADFPDWHLIQMDDSDTDVNKSRNSGWVMGGCKGAFDG